MIVSNATYTETGAPDQQLWGAGSQDIKAKWNYKADTQRLWKIKADKDTYGHTDLALLRYDYDLAGNITQLKDQKNSNQVQCFEYDDLYRLTKGFITDDDTGTSNDCADGYQATGTGWYDRSYNYDPLGNVDSWENHLNNNTYDYTYAQTGNAGLHAATALTGAGGGSFGYDQNGNQTSRPGGDTLVFDAANRLASYTSGSDTTTFAYDADGARIVRDEGATETIYVGGIYETDGTDKRSYYSFAGQVVAYRLQASGTDERYYLISDHLGTNTHQITYSDSSRSSQYYLPFGGSRGVSGGGLDTDRTYTGQVSDETLTGLMFYNARYYDPLLRRFISPDTIVPDSGNPQSLNRYSYVRNNPVNRADPSGHFDYATPKIDGGVRAGTWDDCTANERKVRNEAAEMRSAGYTTKEMAMRWGGRITDNRDMGTSNWDDLLLGPFRFLVFDERECTGSGSAASCATQIAGILPWGKALKLLRFTDELVDGVRLSDEFADGGRHAGDAAGAVCSFSGDTEVVMGDGTTKSIEQIKIGDEVVAHDPETGEQGNRRVSHVWVHDDTLVELNIGGEVLVTTEDHPFWNATDKAWQRADILDPGDLVLAVDGTTLPVVGLDWTTTRNDTAYNLAIEEIHTYFVVVGDGDALVHNKCLPALRSWSSQRFQFGSSTFQLDKSGFTHILERHHPAFWDGSTKATQTFFDSAMSVGDVQAAIGSVARQNREALMNIGAGIGRVRGVVNGQEYILGVSNGRIGQFFPVP